MDRDHDSEVAKSTQWVEDLDLKIEKNQKTKLAHEAGAGAPCMSCSDCPGLELHFWRKCCKICKCSEISHNVKVDEAARYNLVLAKPEQIKKNVHQTRCFELQNEDIPKLYRLLPSSAKQGYVLKFDWIPPNLDKNGVIEYMNLLPTHRVPVSNSPGALLRKYQWNKQIPIHDLNQKAGMQSKVQNNNIKSYMDYINTVRAKVVGQAEVFRLMLPDVSGSEDYVTQIPQHTGFPKAVTKKPYNVPSNFLDQFNKQCQLEHAGSHPAVGDDNATAAVCNVTPELVEGKGLLCHTCQETLDTESLAVRVERNNRSLFWHPNCFVCSTCQELLVDLIYFHHKGSFYCLRDYAKARKITRCFSCDELIFNNQWTRARDKDYHVEHFCCYHCETPLADKDYLEEDQPWCIPCYISELAQTCQTCNRKIGPREPSAKTGALYWHHSAACFKCPNCNKPLPEDGSLVLDILDNPTKVFCSLHCKLSYV